MEIDKIGTKYSMHKIAHAKQWELWTSSSEVCIAYWNMNNRQTGYKVRYLCWSRPKWQWPLMLSTELQCVCVCCTQLKFSLEQLTDRIKGHVSGLTDETKGDLNDSDQWPVMLSTELNCVCFRYKVVHSGNWQFYSSHTGCKIRWSGDWCYIPERRPRLNSCALLKFE